jgi:hypothetical protein
MPEKLIIEEEAPTTSGAVEDVAPAAGLKAAPRAPVIRTTVTPAVQADAANDGTPSWRGTCAICLDLLPLEGDRQNFYDCCCMKICKDCSVKCKEYDTRCPFCRAPRAESAAEWVRRLQKHADEGNAEAQVQLGDAYYHGSTGLKKSLKRACQLYELAAAQGHAEAQSELACCYERGHGVEIDCAAAVQWCRRAADQGLPRAQTNLGVMIYDGSGVAQSYEEAVKWWRLAAAQGYVDALFNLSECYADGEGVPQDLHEALRFYKLAAAHGDVVAASAVDKLTARLAADSGCSN